MKRLDFQSKTPLLESKDFSL